MRHFYFSSLFPCPQSFTLPPPLASFMVVTDAHKQNKNNPFPPCATTSDGVRTLISQFLALLFLFALLVQVPPREREGSVCDWSVFICVFLHFVFECEQETDGKRGNSVPKTVGKKEPGIPQTKTYARC